MKYIGNVQSQANSEVFAVASGALPDGKPVIVNSNGTVSVAASTTVTEALGSAVAFESGDSRFMGGAFDSTNNKVVLVYGDFDNSQYGTAVVGTVSGTSISFGTPVVYNSASSQYDKAAFDTNAGKVLIGYRDQGDSSNGNARVGTVSGTSISFGTEATFTTGAVEYLDMTFDSTNNKVVLVYTDASNGDDGFASVATISGTSVSFGTAVEFSGNNNTAWNVCGFDSTNGKVVIAYEDASDSGKLKSVVGTVSGTSISFGSVATVDSNATERNGLAAVGNGKVVVGYTDEDTSSRLFGAVGTISGTSISYGTRVSITSDSTGGEISVGYDSAADTVIFAYADGGDGNKGKYTPATVSGTSLSLGSEVTFETASVSSSNQTFQTYDSNSEKIVISYRDGDNSGAGTAIVLQPGYTGTNLTSENFLGFSTGFALPAVAGSATTFETGKTDTTDIAYIGSNKVVIAYRQHYAAGGGGQTQDGYCVVGTISGTSISFGTPVIFSNGTGVAQVTYIENDKVVVAYEDDDNSSYSTVRVGTVSGASISFGTAVVMNSANSAFESAVGIGTDKFVGTYRDDGNSDQGTARVGTVSGTNISFGSEVVFNAGGTDGGVAAFIGSDKIVIAYKDVGNSGHGTAIVGTVSGTSISFGSEVVYEAATTGNIDTGIAYIGSDKVVISYQDEGNSDNGTAIVGTVSGTSISFGTAAVFEAATTSITNSTSIGGDKVVIVYSQGSAAGQGNGKYAVGTVSGTGISFDTAVTFNAAPSWDMAVVSPEDNKVAISWGQHYDTSGSRLGQALVTTIEDRGSLADGKVATIQVGGAISTIQGGLTAGQQYFVQGDGTLALTAATPSVIAGTAVSATDLIVKG